MESLFNKISDIDFIKKRLQHRCFPVNIAKFLRTPSLKNICKRLRLKHWFIFSWETSSLVRSAKMTDLLTIFNCKS